MRMKFLPCSESDSSGNSFPRYDRNYLKYINSESFKNGNLLDIKGFLSRIL